MKFLPEDFKFEMIRGRRAGWGNENTTVKVTHVPTGHFCESNKHVSEFVNKELAFAQLRELIECLPEREPLFSNSSIKAPVKTKPHLVLIDGYWRVSKFKKPYTSEANKIYQQAHRFANHLNFERKFIAAESKQ